LNVARPEHLILEPPIEPIRVATAGRLLAGGITAAVLAVLVMAAWLAPDPAGIGTTQRLGMPTCGFRVNTGIPCAGCGLTTSFNHAVRWQWISSVWVQPMGTGLVIASVLTVWVAGYIAATGRPVHRLLGRAVAGRGTKLIVLGVAFGIAAWGFKIALTVLELDGTANRPW
jgi:hypothetical protein